jgi:predicted nucleic acid-binding protein
MIVVSDTTAITTLLKTGKEALLAQLFGSVLVPSAVYSELSRVHEDLPEFIRLVGVRDTFASERLRQQLGRGESEAIVLAEELRADYLLIDERRGRRIARERNLKIIGLLGIVLLARERGLVAAVRPLLLELQSRGGAYLAPELVEATCRSVGE